MSKTNKDKMISKMKEITISQEWKLTQVKLSVMLQWL